MKTVLSCFTHTRPNLLALSISSPKKLISASTGDHTMKSAESSKQNNHQTNKHTTLHKIRHSQTDSVSSRFAIPNTDKQHFSSNSFVKKHRQCNSEQKTGDSVPFSIDEHGRDSLRLQQQPSVTTSCQPHCFPLSLLLFHAHCSLPVPSPSVATTCFLQTPTDTDDFRNFSYNDVFFHQHFCSVIDNDDRVSKR